MMDFEIEEVFAEEEAEAAEVPEQEQPVFDDLGISFGSPFISKELYEEFVMYLLHAKTRSEFIYLEASDRWRIRSSLEAKYSIYNRYEYGIPRMDAISIMEHLMNNQMPKVMKKQGNTYVPDMTETAKAQEKQSLIEREFILWCGASEQRKQDICNCFYETFGQNTVKKYNGSRLYLPDLNPEVRLYPHQRNAVLRMILEKDVLLNHAVGSGKTYEIIAGLHERKRRGISSRNLAVVPNQVLQAFEDTHRLLYPQDHILVITPKDFTPAKRENALKRIQTEDTVAIYMAYSSFSMIPMSFHYRLDQMMEQIQAARASAAAAAAAMNRKEEKIYQRLALKLEEKRNKLKEEDNGNAGISFDELGVTTLAVDEAHNFKNITISTRLDGIVGMHAKGSRMSDDMMEKVQFVRRQGGGVIFATGTPLTNSISDIYTLQKYLQPEQLAFLKIDSFDKWILTFAKKEMEVEVDITSRNFRMQSRFSKFYNLPELVSVFGNVCDTYCGEYSGAGIPKCNGRIDTVLKKSCEQQEYLELLDLRNDMLREKLVGPEEDNYLKITKDGRLMALDVRLVDSEVQPEKETIKAYVCAENIYTCYQKYPDTAQLVFCDTGTPKKGFNIYDELKRILVEMGIPEREIAYAHDAVSESTRRKLFSDVNDAKVRVLIGSTAKVGTGVNVQNRLIALHHLDIPWKPSDITQREGRILRQGNRNLEVFIYRYITEGTFDAYSWQILENKKRFIDQFMEQSMQIRGVRDIADAVLGYAEIKALAMGNPLLKTRVEVVNKLENARRNQQQRKEEQGELRAFLTQYPGKVKGLAAYQKCIEKDKRYYENHHEVMSREACMEFGKRLIYALNRNVLKEKEQIFDTIFGFEIVLPANMEYEKPYILLSGTGGNRYQTDMKNAKEMGCVRRIENTLSQFEKLIWQTRDQIKKEQKQSREAQRILTEGNPYDEEVKDLEVQLKEIDEELRKQAMENI